MQFLDVSAAPTATYNAAADFYDGATNSVWERYGRRTIERLGLERGRHVLTFVAGATKG